MVAGDDTVGVQGAVGVDVVDGCVDAADDDMANPDETDKNGGASFWIKSNKASEPRTFECNEYFSCDIRIVAEKFTPPSDTGKLLGGLKGKLGRAAGLGSTGRMLFDNDDLQSMVTSGYDEENWVLPTLGPNDAFTVFYEPTPEEAALAIAEGKVDAVAFGTSFLANPDLPARIRAGAALNSPDPKTFYSPGPKGYTDYPALATA